MTLDEAMERLRSLGTEQVKRVAVREGAGDRQFGVKLGDIRVVAKEIKADHLLAMELWATGNTDAMLLACLTCRPKDLGLEDLKTMVG